MGHTVTVTLHEAEIQRFYNGPIRRAVEKTVNEGFRLSKAATPRETGELARTMVKGVERRRPPDGDIFGWWGSPLYYALWVHNGTGIFGPERRPITPTQGQFLYFKPSGKLTTARAFGARKRVAKSRNRVVRARSVKGQPRTPFLVEPFRVVMLGVPIRIHDGPLSSLPF